MTQEQKDAVLSELNKRYCDRIEAEDKEQETLDGLEEEA